MVEKYSFEMLSGGLRGTSYKARVSFFPRTSQHPVLHHSLSLLNSTCGTFTAPSQSVKPYRHTARGKQMWWYLYAWIMYIYIYYDFFIIRCAFLTSSPTTFTGTWDHCKAIRWMMKLPRVARFKLYGVLNRAVLAARLLWCSICFGILFGIASIIPSDWPRNRLVANDADEADWGPAWESDNQIPPEHFVYQPFPANNSFKRKWKSSIEPIDQDIAPRWFCTEYMNIFC